MFFDIFYDKNDTYYKDKLKIFLDKEVDKKKEMDLMLKNLNLKKKSLSKQASNIQDERFIN